MIAHIVPVFIVERLEIVQVDEHQRGIAIAALAGRNDLAETILQQAPIGQLRQGVIESQIAYLLLGLLALGDIARHPQQNQFTVIRFW